MTGGLQVQAEETCRALNALEGRVEAELFNWSERRPLADLYHLIGFPTHLHRLTELLREAGRPYVLTLLFGSSREWLRLWLAGIRQRVNSQVLRRRERYDAIMNAAAIITITDADAAAARMIYGLESGRIHVVRNGVSEAYFQPGAQAWHLQFGAQPFVLCVGAIQPRKNQLLLLEACNELRLPGVLLGSVLPGEKEYAARVAVAVQQNEAFGGRWLQHLRNDDPLLPSAYGACRLFALLSAAETQPLSVMQAMAARKPVLLLRAPYVQDPLFCPLPTVGSPERESVAKALSQAWEQGAPTELPRDYSWLEVARRLEGIYSLIVSAPSVRA